MSSPMADVGELSQRAILFDLGGVLMNFSGIAGLASIVRVGHEGERVRSTARESPWPPLMGRRVPSS